MIYERSDHSDYADEWHDTDRIDGNRILVGDMIACQIFTVNSAQSDRS